MPVGKQYVATALAGGENSRVSPAGPNRKGLVIQNTGVNPGSYRFGNKTQGDGGDALLTPGEKHEYLIPETCPTDALNFASTLGTTFAVVEILPGENNGR